MVKAIYDAHRIEEDQRIRMIGEQAKTQLVGALVDSEPEKVARYIKKVTERFPDVKHVDTKPMTPGVVLVRFAPKIAN